MKTDARWVHRYAILVALCALIAIAFGAIVTSLVRPIAPTPTAIGSSAIVFESWHRAAGALAAMMMIVLAVWLAAAKFQKHVVQLAWISAAAGLMEGALAGRAGILHALLGPLFFACIACIAVMTSASWKRGPQPIEDSWRPSMRSLTVAATAVVLLQITLGAAYRYRALGVLWHILNAMIVLLLILIVAVFLIRQFPEHPSLKPAAVALAVITSIQVFLGFTTFLMLIMLPETSLAVVISSVLHVVNGALTLGASAVLAILIRYNVRRAV